jgi:ABC-type protease/lipase transport system fused ATPase/permease subunit
MKKLSLKYIPQLLLVIFLIKALIFNLTTLNDVLIITVLSTLTGFFELRLEGKAIKELNEQIKKLSDNDKQQEEIIKDIRNIISTMKVSSGIRNVR